jgi:undecaprenyl-diphosphatase
LVGADRSVERWIVHHRAGWLDPLFVGLSWIGTVGLVWVVLGVVLAFALRRPALAPLTAAAVLLADGVAIALKRAVPLDRPPVRYPLPEALVRVPHDGSFPSGHAATSFAAALLLSFAAPRLAPGFVLLAIAIGFSRVYVGVHYPLDVLGGAAVGAAVAGLSLAVPAIRTRALRARPSEPTGRHVGR